MYNEATGKMQSSQMKLKALFKCLSNPVFTLQAFLEVHELSFYTLSSSHDVYYYCIYCDVAFESTKNTTNRTSVCPTDLTN
jgi:hypothetical protein